MLHCTELVRRSKQFAYTDKNKIVSKRDDNLPVGFIMLSLAGFYVFFGPLSVRDSAWRYIVSAFYFVSNPPANLICAGVEYLEKPKTSKEEA